MPNVWRTGSFFALLVCRNQPGAAGCVRDAPGVGAPQPAEGLEVQGWVAAAVLRAGTDPD